MTSHGCSLNTCYTVQEIHVLQAVGRRDLTSVLHQVMANAEFQRLPLVDQNMVKGIVTAAENGTLSAYVQQVGYSTLLTLFDGKTLNNILSFTFDHSHSSL